MMKVQIFSNQIDEYYKFCYTLLLDLPSESEGRKPCLFHSMSFTLKVYQVKKCSLQTHPCNENRVFLVQFFSQGKPCSGPVLALYGIAVFIRCPQIYSLKNFLCNIAKFRKNQGKNDGVPTFFYVKVFRWTRLLSL